MNGETNHPQPADKTQDDKKRPVGRPQLEFPEPIPDTPVNVAKSIFRLKPNKPSFE